MRPLVGIAFTFLLFVSLFGFHISFMLQRNAVRAEMRLLAKQEKMLHARQFVFTEVEYSNLTKYDEEKEFSLNGEMYDVLKKEVSNSKIVLTAYFDHKETNIVNLFLQLFEEDVDREGNTRSIQIAFSLPEYTAQFSVFCFFDNGVVFTLPRTCSRILFLSYNPLTPPPNLATA